MDAEKSWRMQNAIHIVKKCVIDCHKQKILSVLTIYLLLVSDYSNTQFYILVQPSPTSACHFRSISTSSILTSLSHLNSVHVSAKL